MRKKTFAGLCAVGAALILGYFAIALKAFYVSMPILEQNELSSDARIAVDSWYSENRLFGRSRFNSKLVPFMLMHPFQPRTKPVQAYYFSDVKGREIVFLVFHGLGERREDKREFELVNRELVEVP